MLPLLIFAFLLNMSAGLALQGQAGAEESQRQAVETQVANLLIYHSAARRYFLGNPTPGTANDAAIALPAWYGKSSDWRAVYDGRCTITYAASGQAALRPALLTEALVKVTGGDAGIGTVSAGQIVSQATLAILAPAGAIPSNAATYVSCS